jgi:hypothetical protein
MADNQWRLTFDGYASARSIINPKPEQIEELIRALDNDTHTTVSLEDKIGRMLVIGGQNDTVVVHCDLMYPTEKPFRLVNPQARDNMQPLVLSLDGEETSFPARQGVSKDVAVKAVLDFHATHRPSGDLAWINEHGETVDPDRLDS